jgi:hypothetical protein
LPVHSAHVGEDREVHYRWHPYFGLRVCVRWVERATGQFLKVEGPSGVVVSIPGWMVDPLVCADMCIGRPQVDLAALSELKRLVTPTAAPAHFLREDGCAREEPDETAQCACGDLGPADEPDVRARQGGRDEQCGAGCAKALTTLAQILMQAAGLVVEELDDERH